ncbi:MAG: glycosyltransferase, partial [Acetobacteraceae bacterium]
RALNGEILIRSFRFEISRPQDAEDGPTIRRRIARVEADAYAAALPRIRRRTRFRLVLRLRDPDDRTTLAATLQSLRHQIYDEWRLLLLVDHASDYPRARAAVSVLAPELLDRTDIAHLTRTAWPGSEALAERTLVTLLTQGDELGIDALAEIALARGDAPEADVLYADETRISPASGEREPFFKPGFSPELLRSTNYIGRPWYVTLALLRRAGISPSTMSRNGEYDAVLRCTELARAVVHVPKLLCRRGPAAPESPATEQRALVASASRVGFTAAVMPGAVAGTWRLRRSDQPRVSISIIIPTCASGGHIETCIRSLRAHTGRHDVQIVCIENIPSAQGHWRDWLRRHADRVIGIEEAFNWSRFNNLAAAEAGGDYLLFLNDDVEIEQPDWLDAMLEPLAWPDVAVVGARLLYPDRSVQHGGMFLGEFGIGRHAFRFAAEEEPGYFGLALTIRNVIAVTGACMMMRRSHFHQLNGFDESHAVVNNDLDFCLRTHAAGRRIVYTPHACLIHHELASRATVPEEFDRTAFATRWRSRFAMGDPFHNPNLSKQHDDFRPNEEPVRVTAGAHGLFAVSEINRILVVKVDHIGDFITALPAMRRLKQHFPTATLHVLAASGARAFAEAEACIDGFIEFEFFHARSGLGQRELTEGDYATLHARLLPHG